MTNIIFNKGKEFNDVALEIEEIFKTWAESSSLNEKEIINLIERDNFNIIFTQEELTLRNANKLIGLPFTWRKDEISYEEFWVDMALLLLHICSKTSNENTNKKIRLFIKEHNKK